MAKAAKMKVSEEQKLTTPEFRVSFPHVMKAHQFPGGKPEYSVTGLFPKNGDLSRLKLAIKHAKISKFGPDQREWPHDLQSPVSDGDSPAYEGKEGYAGHWVIKFKSNESNRPEVFGTDGEELLNERDFYPGCYAKAVVFAFGWEFGNKCGVSFILDGVKKMRDGKPLGGRKSTKDAFGPPDLEENANDEQDSDEDF